MDANFDPHNDACDRFSYTLNFMSEEEISGLDSCENKDEVTEYMSQFYERT